MIKIKIEFIVLLSIMLSVVLWFSWELRTLVEIVSH